MTTTIKAPRKCGDCGKTGHDRRNCPLRTIVASGPVVATVMEALVVEAKDGEMVNLVAKGEPMAVVIETTEGATAPLTERVWHSLQLAFFNLLATMTVCILLRARAGTGKTTTIIEAIRRLPPGLRIMLCAFNTKIADELAARVGATAQAKTLGSIGYGVIGRKLGFDTLRRIMVQGKERELGLAQYVCDQRSRIPLAVIEKTIEERIVGTPAAERQQAHTAAENKIWSEIYAAVGKLHTKGRELLPLAQSGRELVPFATKFDCVSVDADWLRDSLTINRLADLAYECMVLAAREIPQVDFADLIYLPVRNRWMRRDYDLVIVDEAQDMTRAQLMLAMGICKEGGKVVIVGDDRQAIYGFRGASSGTLDALKVELNATELPLNVTYRCGKKIVAEAARLVPDFVAHESNPDGEVVEHTPATMHKEVAIGDAIIGRANAPLVAVAMKLIREGKRARVEGREIGAGLVALVEKLTGSVNSIPAFLGKLKAWEERELVRARKARSGDDLAALEEQITDKAETLRVLTDGVESVGALKARITGLFSNADDKKGAFTEYVTCLTAHKAKGLEWDRVFLLMDTFKSRRAPDGTPPSDDQILEEQNILYVATTRAKAYLGYVRTNG